jgi:hypothetical protein
MGDSEGIVSAVAVFVLSSGQPYTQCAFREARPAACLRNEVRSVVRSGGDMPVVTAESLVG